MNDYERKQEDRRQRYLDRAEKAEANGNRILADLTNDGIPLGQPILVGHHSEGRHRRALAKRDRNLEKGVGELDKAKHYRDKAASVGGGGVSSDDPDAIAKLTAQLETLEARHKADKALNAAWRKAGRPTPNGQPEEWKAFLAGYGWSEAAIEKTMGISWYSWSQPVEKYVLSNRSANMKRIRDRIEELRRADEREDREVRYDDIGLTAEQATDDNRVRLWFDAKPSEDVRAVVKAAGFRWARSIGAWQRHLNNAGVYAVERVVRELRQSPPLPVSAEN